MTTTTKAACNGYRRIHLVDESEIEEVVPTENGFTITTCTTCLNEKDHDRRIENGNNLVIRLRNEGK